MIAKTHTSPLSRDASITVAYSIVLTVNAQKSANASPMSGLNDLVSLFRYYQSIENYLYIFAK